MNNKTIILQSKDLLNKSSVFENNDPDLHDFKLSTMQTMEADMIIFIPEVGGSAIKFKVLKSRYGADGWFKVRT